MDVSDKTLISHDVSKNFVVEGNIDDYFIFEITSLTPNTNLIQIYENIYGGGSWFARSVGTTYGFSGGDYSIFFADGYPKSASHIRIVVPAYGSYSFDIFSSNYLIQDTYTITLPAMNPPSYLSSYSYKVTPPSYQLEGVKFNILSYINPQYWISFAAPNNLSYAISSIINNNYNFFVNGYDVNATGLSTIYGRRGVIISPSGTYTATIDHGMLPSGQQSFTIYVLKINNLTFTVDGNNVIFNYSVMNGDSLATSEIKNIALQRVSDISGNSVMDSILIKDAAGNPINNGTPAYSYTHVDLQNGATGFYRLAVTTNTTPEGGAERTFYTSAIPVSLTNGPICFLGHAPVATPSGYKRIDTLNKGDLVLTESGKAVPIQRVEILRVRPSSINNPYIIPQGLYGATEELLISPRHKVATEGGKMVEARDLGLKQKTMKAPFNYYNLELPDWANMRVAGVEVESLAPIKRVVASLAQLKWLVSNQKSGSNISVVHRA